MLFTVLSISNTALLSVGKASDEYRIASKWYSKAADDFGDKAFEGSFFGKMLGAAGAGLAMGLVGGLAARAFNSPSAGLSAMESLQASWITDEFNRRRDLADQSFESSYITPKVWKMTSPAPSPPKSASATDRFSASKSQVQQLVTESKRPPRARMTCYTYHC